MKGLLRKITGKLETIYVENMNFIWFMSGALLACLSIILYVCFRY